MGLRDTDIDYILLTHLDCDHVNGLKLVRNAKHIFVSRDEMKFALTKSLINKIRYQSCWWSGLNLTLFDWNGSEGPVHRSYDLFNDGSVIMVNIPGHSNGLFAVKICNGEGKFVLLFSDGGYASKSWQEMIPSGIAANREQQYESLKWIREKSLDANCVESLANHDADVSPHIIVL